MFSCSQLGQPYLRFLGQKSKSKKTILPTNLGQSMRTRKASDVVLSPSKPLQEAENLKLTNLGQFRSSHTWLETKSLKQFRAKFLQTSMILWESKEAARAFQRVEF